MKIKNRLPIRFLEISLAIILFSLMSVTGIFAQEIDSNNQLVVLYDSEESNFSEVSIDQDKIQSVEKVSDNVDLITVKDSNDLNEIKKEIQSSDAVEAVDKEAKAVMLSDPNDKHFDKQPYLKEMGFGNISAGNGTVKVAVVDTGVNANHEDLEGRIEESGYNFIDDNEDTHDQQGHGTFAAGIITASTNNGKGIAGIVDNAHVTVVPYTVLDSNGEGKASSVIGALDLLTKRSDVKVINLSFGFEEGNEDTFNAIDVVLSRLRSQGKVIVAASGNGGEEGIYFPARSINTIAVGAVNENNERCTEKDWGEGNGSTYGKGLDVVAPGNMIASLSIEPTQYKYNSGTSFSTPFVSGAVALALTNDPSINLSKARKALEATSLDIQPAGKDIYTGVGLIQIDKFVNQFEQKQGALEPGLFDIYIPGQDSYTLKVDDTLNLQAKVLTDGETGTIEWSSSDPSIAKVNSNGKVTAVAPGTCKITTECLGHDDHITIKVEDPTPPEPETEPVKIYRLYNAENNEHLYTSDANEAKILADSGWTDEGIGWESPDQGDAVYRLYSDIAKEHLYTKDKNEVKELSDSGTWTVDNNNEPLFYSGGETPIYRLYNEAVQRHHLTIDKNEYDLLKDQGWSQEGVALYSL